MTQSFSFDKHAAANAFLFLCLLLAGCDSPPRAYQSRVSPRLVSRLESRSVTPAQLHGESEGGHMRLPFQWNAPELVTTKLFLREGLPNIRVNVNGHERNFIIDTGSEHCVMEADMALACGLHILSTEMKRVTLRGVSGSESAMIGLPDRMEIGAWHWEGVPCLVRTVRNEMEGGGRSRHRVALNLIGMDVLRCMCSWVTLDFPKGIAQFGFRSTWQPSSRRCWGMPVNYLGQLPHVRIGDGKTTWSALVDTGASTIAEINSREAHLSGLDARAHKITVARVGLGETASLPEYSRVILPQLTGLGPPIRHPAALIVPDKSKIGTGLFQHFRVTLDFKRDRLWLEDAQ